MKKILFSLLFVLVSSSYGQSNDAIADVYIKRAITATQNIDFETALEEFEKAMKYKDTITDRKIASLGSLIYFENYHKQSTLELQLVLLEKAKEYSSQYFNLNPNKNTEEYTNNTDNYVLILESLETLKNKIQKEKEERLRKERELRMIDSLKTVWKTKADALAFKADSVYSFNKYGASVFKKNEFYGIVNDLGEVIVEANEYKDYVSFDGFIVLKNDIQYPNKLYGYNSSLKTGYVLPSISDFNTLSTHYGKVMLPRGNGRLVSYPNNSREAMVYDLNLKKFIKVSNEPDLLKNLKRADVIDKYKDEGDVKYDGEWYIFGGHLGGGIHPLYAEEGYTLKGFVCSIDGKFLNTISDYQYLGYFYDGKYEAVKGTEVYWVNQNGTRVGEAVSEAAKYTGSSIIRKSESGAYLILKDSMIVSGDKKLEKMADYLRKYANQQ